MSSLACLGARYFEAEIIKFRVFNWLNVEKLESAKAKLGRYDYFIKWKHLLLHRYIIN